ncbi:hypothetical protein [uncultured Thiodictyon sp.]|uniref:hypothetical protein n=1 Tax=uncultured Thiodictyon sp. TaxID=1846217 RepID=UPI0025D55CFE|nr:hypothetical protein [uncultured Thiodictyon sp.]
MSDLAKELVVDDVGSGDTVNVCRISVTPLNADVSAVVLDYEVQDNRSPADSAKFIKAISSIVKKYNKKLFLYVNPLNAGGAKTSGLTPELFGDVVDYVDYIGLLITRRKGKALQEDIDDQHGLLAGWGGKLAFVVDISNFTDDEMIVIRKNAFKYKVKFVMLWRNGSSFGDNCSTRSYASVKCLVSGNCSQ